MYMEMKIQVFYHQQCDISANPSSDIKSLYTDQSVGQNNHDIRKLSTDYNYHDHKFTFDMTNMNQITGRKKKI